MTLNEINTAIAKACGYENIYTYGEKLYGDFNCSHSVLVPNYYSDLNACAEMEKTLSMKQLCEYEIALNRMELSFNYGYVEQVICATAPQRCEAFLRVKGLWRE